MSDQITLGAPDPDTLLQEIQGQTITQGWDVVSVMSVEQVNNLLAQQYVTKLANGNDLPPINGITQVFEEFSAQFIDVVLGPPLIQFSLSLAPQEAILTLNFISGTINTVQVQNGISTIVTSQTILPGDNYVLTGVVPLASVQGEVDNQHNVVIDITNAGSFTAKLGFPSGAEPVLGQFFLEILQNPESPFSYVVGTLQYDPAATGLTPVMFDFATQLDHTDSSDNGRLLIFIATTYHPGGGSQTALSFANLVPYGYSATLIVSNLVLLQNIIKPAIEDEYKQKKFVVEVDLDTQPAGHAHSLIVSSGALDFGQRNFEIGGGYVKSDGDIQIPIANATFTCSNQYILQLDLDSTSSHLWTYFDGLKLTSGHVECNVSIHSTLTPSIDSSNNISFTVANNPNITAASTDTWFRPPQNVYDMLQQFVSTNLTPLTNLRIPSVSTFAVNNLLFPGQNALSFQKAYVPGDLVIFGQISPVILETAPLQVTLAAGQTQQFNATLSGNVLPSSAVTWKLKSLGCADSVGSIDQTGLYTAPATITHSQTIVVIGTTIQGNNTAQSAITLVPSGILISPSVVIVPYGDNSPQAISAVVAGTGTQAVNWSVSAGGGSIKDGFYNPATNAGSAPVAVAITATSQANPPEQGTATVVLMDAGTAVGGVGVSPEIASLGAAKTQQFTAENAKKNPFSGVQWLLFPNIGSISADGVYTAPSSIESPQTVVIVASVNNPFSGGNNAGIAVITLLP